MSSSITMEQQENYTKKLARAQKRVNDIKKFYQHLRIYIIINLLLLFVKYRAMDFLTTKGIQDPGFLEWFQWNFIGTPVLWGIGLLVHALYVFKFDAKPLKDLKPKFLKDWESKQIQKYMDENE